MRLKCDLKFKHLYEMQFKVSNVIKKSKVFSLKERKAVH